MKKQIHGTYSSYTKGLCRCIKCKEANKLHKRNWISKNREKWNEYMRNWRSGVIIPLSGQVTDSIDEIGLDT